MESNERCAEEALSLRLSRRLTIPSTGATPAKYMATTWIGGKYFVKAMGGGGRTHRLNNISHKHGGNMIVPLRQKCVITSAIYASQKIADNEGLNMIENRQCLERASESI